MRSEKSLFPRQRALLDEIERFTRESGYPPTLRELASAIGVRSPSGVRQQIKALERRGFLKVAAGRPRGIVSLRRKSGGESIPILGYVRAGLPVDVDEVEQGRLELGKAMGIASERCFAVKVEGDSMIEEHIVEGDYVVLDPGREANPGQVVAAAIDGAVTLKTYYPVDNGVELRPANVRMKPILLEPDQVYDARILGVAVALVRSL